MVKLQKKPYFGSIINNPNTFIMKKIIFLIISFVSISAIAQRFPEIRNYNGAKAGVNFFNINSDDIEFNSGTGFNVAFIRRLPLVDMLEANVYAEFQQSNFSGNAIDLLSSNSNQIEVDYQLLAGKIGAMINFKAYGPYVSLLLGPVIQFNGELKYDDEYENYLATTIEDGNDTALVTVDDLSKISGFNFLLAGGISAGHMNYKAYAMYEYGINNVLSSVNTTSGSLNGHTVNLIVGAIIYF